MKTPTKWFIGGSAVVVIGVGVVLTTAPAKVPLSSPSAAPRQVRPPQALAHQHPAKKTLVHPTQKPAPAKPPAALSSYEAISYNPAPVNSIQTAQDPSNPQKTWALVPVAIHEGGNATATLWFGVRQTPKAAWTWIPSALPGRLSAQLPKPAYNALQWAFDLHEGKPGPTNLSGVVSWKSITGVVSEPQGWTMENVSAANSATGQAGVQIVVWQQSFYGSFHGLYGMISDWDAQNASTGNRALDLIEPSSLPLTTVTNARYVKPG